MKKYGRTDANQKRVVQDLRKSGVSVLSLADIGGGCPDLLVCCAGKLRLFEVKDGAKSKSRRKLTPDQVEFHKVWPVTVVTSSEDALRAIGVLPWI